jgi:hypothetical protein
MTDPSPSSPPPSPPPSLSFYRRREEHTECVVHPKPNNGFLVRLVKASVESTTGHKVYIDESSFHPYDSILIKKAMIIAVENYMLTGNPFFCMGSLTCKFNEKLDPKYTFISDNDDEVIDRLFVYIKSV